MSEITLKNIEDHLKASVKNYMSITVGNSRKAIQKPVLANENDRPTYWLWSDVQKTGKTLHELLTQFSKQYENFLMISARMVHGTSSVPSSLPPIKFVNKPASDMKEQQHNATQQQTAPVAQQPLQAVPVQQWTPQPYGMNAGMNAEYIGAMVKAEKSDMLRDRVDELKNERDELKIENKRLTHENINLQSKVNNNELATDLLLKAKDLDKKSILDSDAVKDLAKMLPALIANQGAAAHAMPQAPGMAAGLTGIKKELVDAIIASTADDNTLNLLNVVGNGFSNQEFVNELIQLVTKFNLAQ